MPECETCFAVVTDLDKHMDWHGSTAPEPTAQERVNTKLTENGADYRWKDRRQVPHVYIHDKLVEDPTVCIHDKKLSGECSYCAANSVTSGV
jgi:hypothetical protein